MRTIRKILQDIRPGVDFDASTDFVREGLLDSFDLIKLVDELESEFGICILGKEIVPENFINGERIDFLVSQHLTPKSEQPWM